VGEKGQFDIVLNHKQSQDMTTSETGTLNLELLSLETNKAIKTQKLEISLSSI